MAIVHPVNSAGRFVPEVDSDRPGFVIHESWFEHRRMSDRCAREGLTMTFHSEHRPLQAYADAVADAGLLIERIAEVGEPDPSDKWHSVPLFLHIKAVKVANR